MPTPCLNLSRAKLPTIDTRTPMQSDSGEHPLSENETKRECDAQRELIGWLDKQQQQQNACLAELVHTQLGSTLTALTMRLALLERHIGGNSNIPDWTQHWDKVQRLLTSITETTRTLQGRLRPFAVESLGFVASLTELLQQFERRTNITSTTTVAGMAPELMSDVAQGLLRIIESALSNIERHARASQVNVQITSDQACVVLAIADNGRGFDADHLDWNQTHGLRLMRERALQHHAQLTITSSTGVGCRITIVLPV